MNHIRAHLASCMSHVVSNDIHEVAIATRNWWRRKPARGFIVFLSNLADVHLTPRGRTVRRQVYRML